MHVLINVLQVIWLEEYLQTWKNTLIVVSHARDFLNEVCTDMLHLSNKQITRCVNTTTTTRRPPPCLARP